jgi:hypothetical protein
MRVPPVVQGFAHYGYPENLIPVVGALELLCTLVYVVPRTSRLGAILLTGYLGGATATNLRVNDPSYAMTVILGILVWGGLFLRDDRLRAFVKIDRSTSGSMQEGKRGSAGLEYLAAGLQN